MARRVQQNHQHGGFVVLLLINYTQMAFAPVEVFLVLLELHPVATVLISRLHKESFVVLCIQKED
jgi:hypothetical protein